MYIHVSFSLSRSLSISLYLFSISVSVWLSLTHSLTHSLSNSLTLLLHRFSFTACKYYRLYLCFTLLRAWSGAPSCSTASASQYASAYLRTF
jgi:hypothetical protein